MPYPESCFTNLIGIRGLCDPVDTNAMYWLDDVPGVDLTKLSQIAGPDAPSGKKTGEKLIESAARIMAADVEAIYDGQYKVENTLVAGCSTCKFTGNYASGSQRGILIKDQTQSSFSKLLIDKLTVKLNSTGTFTIVIDDGANPRSIPFDFVAGLEYELTNLNYTTKSKSVRVYISESTALLAQLSCPRSGSGCGCSGKSAVVSDLVYTGTASGVESQQAYGFIPCAFIRCEADDLLCFVAHSAPRMIGMALLYKTAELYFTEKLQSTRNNRVAGTGTDDTKEDVKTYSKKYTDKLNGVGTRGVKDLVFTTLQQTRDSCVLCNSLLGTSWATG